MHSPFIRRFQWMLLSAIFIAVCLVFFVSSRMNMVALYTISYHAMEPYLTKGESLLQGYVQGEYTQEELQNLLNPELKLNTFFMILLDQDSQVIAASDEAMAHVEPAELDSLPDSAVQPVSGSLLLLGKDKKMHNLILGRVVEIQGDKIGYVFAGRSTGEFNTISDWYNVRMFLILCPLFLALAVASYFVFRKMSRPARMLTMAALQMADENFDIKLDETLPGELGQLSRVFNRMASNLAQTIFSLKYERNSMKLILDGLTEGIIAMDGAGNILHHNEASARLLGGEDGEPYRKIVAGMRECLAGDDGAAGKLAARDRVLEYSLLRVVVEEGSGEGIIALLRDVTEAERLENTRRDYVANISHELRTPLASIRGLIEPLRDGIVQKPEDKQRYYGIIANEVMRLSRLVNDLLELSGLQSDSKSFQQERIDTEDMMQELYHRNVKLFDEAHVHFVLEMEDGLPFVWANEDRVVQVLTIFLDNARKYTPEGREVRLCAHTREKSVYFSVRDTGPGMEEEVSRHIFERFYQGNQFRSDRGNGLGLSIAKEVLEKMKLSVELQSRAGEGSEFGFEVPTEAK